MHRSTVFRLQPWRTRLPQFLATGLRKKETPKGGLPQTDDADEAHESPDEEARDDGERTLGESPDKRTKLIALVVVMRLLPAA